MKEPTQSKAGKPLIIVESPAKADTIKKYLKGEYEVLASKGHVKDLPEKALGVDIARGFRPRFVVVPSRRKTLEALKRAASQANKVLLAPDPDREGEAIAYHIAEEIKAAQPNIERVLFREITPSGIREGLSNPRPLDLNMVESQIARRILDRLVGYCISPILWRKVKGGLSAGRVQSPALRLIVEREREIESFVPKEYWVIKALLRVEETSEEFSATLWRLASRKAEIRNQGEAEGLIERLRTKPFVVESLEAKEQRKPPAPPFITSTLQQEASRLLKFSPTKTMQIAQTLYEGVEVGDEGRVGLITYMRTDSVRVAEEAIVAARKEIKSRFGEEYLPGRPRTYKSRPGAQEAHEAIRPTSVERRPEDLKPYLKPDEFKLYQLIYQRFLASQMTDAIYDQTIVTIRAEDALFRTTGMTLKHEGYLLAWGHDKENGEEGEEEEEKIPKGLREGQILTLLDLKGEQKFTKPPPRYSEATLIRELEERGIGRPSTYATIVSHILEKGYCEKQGGKLRPTELGRLVSDLLVRHFPEQVDYEFTARMESALDEIEAGRRDRLNLLQDFWGSFSTTLRKAEEEMKSARAEAYPTGIACDWCGKEMVVRFGRNGPFLGCSGFPECRRVREFERDEHGHIKVREEQGQCPKCGSPLVERTGKYGRFLACSAYPKCDFSKPISSGFACPQEGCDGSLIEKRSKKGKTYYVCSRYPACNFSTSSEPAAGPCPLCGAKTLFFRKGRFGRVKICLREGCSFRERLKGKKEQG